jgi:hypothetical protein
MVSDAKKTANVAQFLIQKIYLGKVGNGSAALVK